MIQVAKKYLSVYRQFINTSFAEATTYRLNFVLLILMDIVFYVTSLMSVSFIFNHVEQIGPWTRAPFMFFISFMLALDQIHMTLVSENFWEFSFRIRQGLLDFDLIRPLSTLFTSFFRFIRAASSLNIIVTSGFLIHYGVEAGVSWHSWALLPVFLVLALVLLVSLEILMSMLMFVTIESWGINFLRMQFQNLSRWPDFVYGYYVRKVFIIAFPILLVGSAPVRFLLDWQDWQLLPLFFGAIAVLWVLIPILWRWGLKHYESASS